MYKRCVELQAVAREIYGFAGLSDDEILALATDEDEDDKALEKVDATFAFLLMLPIHGAQQV